MLPDHPKAHSIRVDADNRHVLVPTLGNDRVNQFTFDAATGRLTPNTPPAVEVTANAGPRHFVFHPGGARVYVLGELDGHVYAFDYDAGRGTLAHTQTISALPPDFSGKPSAADLHITPDGRFLYASVRATSTLAGFRVDPVSGALTAIGSVPTERQPRGFNIDAVRPLPARGRSALPRPVELRDRSGQRTSQQAQGIRDGPKPQLGRDRRPALKESPWPACVIGSP